MNGKNWAEKWMEGQLHDCDLSPSEEARMEKVIAANWYRYNCRHCQRFEEDVPMRKDLGDWVCINQRECHRVAFRKTLKVIQGGLSWEKH